MAGAELKGPLCDYDVDAILAGDIVDLPKQERKAVHVFWSSTFTDYATERNMLMKEAVPVLRQYCSEYGLDFQISDMRWGIRDEAQDDHATTELCLQEIKRCQNLSLGPYFACFLGNRYGYRPYPNRIECKEFEILYKCAQELGRDIKLLDEWYCIDSNAVPQEYVLQTISSKFPYYNDESEENEVLRKREVEEWNAIDRMFVTIFRESADKAWRDGLISDETKHQYFQSVTENEVYHGLLAADDVNQRVIYYDRKFSTINHTDIKAKRFQDMEGQEVDEEAQALLDELKTKRVPSVLQTRNSLHSSINWTPIGVDEENKDHSEYLHQVRDFFIEETKRLVDLSVDMQKWNKSKTSKSHFREILKHSYIAHEKSREFCGQRNMVMQIKRKLNQKFGEDLPEGSNEDGDKNQSMKESKEQAQKEAAAREEFQKKTGALYASEGNQINVQELMNKFLFKPKLGKHNRPILISGLSGSGQTTLLAYVISKIDDWASPLKPVKVMRFLGTSSQASTIQDTLIGIVKQIQVNYEVKQEFQDEVFQNFFLLVAYLQSLVRKIDTTEKPLYIILDSVDRLLPDDWLHSMKWLPTELPIGVHMIVSLSCQLANSIRKTKAIISDGSRHIAMTDMDSSTGEKMLTNYMESISRTLTKEQKEYTMHKFRDCPRPLYMTLSKNEASIWKSYDDVANCMLGDTILTAIDAIFERLEAKHGHLLMARSLGYLTAAKHGLTDTELEDVLSLDDEVLQDTYLYHLPPDPEHIRLPTSLWRRIHIDLGDNLVVRQANEKDTLTWYHSQFKEAAKRRYLTNETSVGIHSMLVDYFNGTWAGKVKPLELYKKKKGSFPNALRNVPSQPLQFCPGKYNLRKLDELPVHLIHSQRYEDFMEKIARSFEWLYTSCKAFNIKDVIKEMDTLQAQEHAESMEEYREELQTLRSCLGVAVDAVNKDVDNFASQLIGQLPSEDENLPEGLQSLRRQAVTWAETSTVPLLIPATQCLPPPSDDLKMSMDFTIALDNESTTMETKLTVSKENNFLYVVNHLKWNMGDIIQICNLSRNGRPMDLEYMPFKDFKTIQLVGADKYLLCEVYITRDEVNPLFRKVLLNTDLTEVQSLPKEAQVLCVSQDGNISLIQAQDKNGKFSAIFDMDTALERCRLRQEFKEYQDALFSHDSSYLVTFDKSDGITVWQVKSGKKLYTLKSEDNDGFIPDYEDYKNFMHVLPGNQLLGRGLTVTGSKSILLWDLNRGTVISKMDGHSCKVDIISLSHSNKRAVSGTKDASDATDAKYFRVWDLDKSQELACSEMTGPFSSLNFFGKHENLIMACARLSKSSILWMLRGSALIPVYEVLGHSEHVVFAQCTPKGDQFISASVDNTVKVWSVDCIMQRVQDHIEKFPTKEATARKCEVMKQAPAVAGHSKMLTTCFAVSRDGKNAVVGTADGWILFYDLESYKISKHQRPENGSVHHVLATGDSKYFISAGTGIYVWEAASGELVYELVGLNGYDGKFQPSCLAESCNTLVVGFSGTECRGDIFDLNTGTKVNTMEGLNGFRKVAISSDAKMVATAYFGMPIIFNTETGQSPMNQETMEAVHADTTWVSFSPMDTYVVTCATDGSVRVFDTDSAQYRFHFQHKSAVSKAFFTNDNSKLITPGSFTIYIWCLGKGQLLHSLSRHLDIILDIELVCDGQFLISSGKDKQIYVWSVNDRVTVTSFRGYSPIKKIGAAADLSSVIYFPENIAYLGVFKPNPALQAVCKGQYEVDVPDNVQTAQALAFGFSSNKVSSKASKTCSIL